MSTEEQSELQALRQAVARLEAKVEQHEELLDKTISALAITSRAIEIVFSTAVKYFVTQDSYAVGMSVRGVMSTMQGAIATLRTAVEKARQHDE